MNTTVIEQKNNEERYYYHDRQKIIIYNEKNHYYDVYQQWEKYLSEFDYSKEYIYQAKRHIVYFLFFLENQKILELKAIDKSIILNYLYKYPFYYSKSTIKNRNKYLRKIIRFLYLKDFIQKDYSIFVPEIKISNYSSIPSVWNEDDVQKLIDSIDLDSKKGKRLYLVLLLAIRYGLRIMDIRNLKFENIDWINKKITLVQSKTKNEVSFPLLPDIYSALVDYIKNARPEANEPYVILTLDGKHFQHDNFFEKINTVLKNNNIVIKNQKKGIHSMRHTLASSLLKENIPLPIISTILGHANTSSTSNYIKVNQNQLKRCCLSLKEVLNNEKL